MLITSLLILVGLLRRLCRRLRLVATQRIGRRRPLGRTVRIFRPNSAPVHDKRGAMGDGVVAEAEIAVFAGFPSSTCPRRSDSERAGPLYS
jgi:hypothetical protein